MPHIPAPAHARPAARVGAAPSPGPADRRAVPIGRAARLLAAAGVTLLVAGPPAHAQQGATPSYRTPVTPPQPGLGPHGSGNPTVGRSGVIAPPAGVDNGMTTTPGTPGVAAPMPVIPPPGTHANPSAPVPR